MHPVQASGANESIVFIGGEGDTAVRRQPIAEGLGQGKEEEQEKEKPIYHRSL